MCEAKWQEICIISVFNRFGYLGYLLGLVASVSHFFVQAPTWSESLSSLTCSEWLWLFKAKPHLLSESQDHIRPVCAFGCLGTDSLDSAKLNETTQTGSKLWEGLVLAIQLSFQRSHRRINFRFNSHSNSKQWTQPASTATELKDKEVPWSVPCVHLSVIIMFIFYLVAMALICHEESHSPMDVVSNTCWISHVWPGLSNDSILWILWILLRIIFSLITYLSQSPSHLSLHQDQILSSRDFGTSSGSRVLVTQAFVSVTWQAKPLVNIQKTLSKTSGVWVTTCNHPAKGTKGSDAKSATLDATPVLAC